VPSKTHSEPRGFGHVACWVFDLDNTLYPHHLNLWQQVDTRIRDFIADFLQVPHDQAFRIQKDYYKRYGTTMRGLMSEHGLNPDDYLEFVPTRSTIRRSRPIRRSARRWRNCRGASSSSPTARASTPTRLMRRLAVHEHFEDVFDIVAAELEPKPSRKTYERFLVRHGVEADKAAMFEDLARNLEAPHALGMTTVLVVPEGQREVFREDWELEGRDDPHVDHVTDDLSSFLHAIARRD